MISFITWTANPDLISSPVTVRWYGLMFAIGFLVGYEIVYRIFKHEGAPEKWLAPLFFYVVIATVLGARLGHVFFYDWSYYSQHPGDILKIWEGGLASHGGTIGIIIAIFIFSWSVTKKIDKKIIGPIILTFLSFFVGLLPFDALINDCICWVLLILALCWAFSMDGVLWTLDRLCIPIGFVGALIRIGNLMNHEIYGGPTSMPWGFRFIDNINQYMHGAEPIFTQPSHPTQLYEALCYLVVFAVCMYLYWRRNAQERPGFLLGVFLIGIFGSRFFIEFLKNVQEQWEIGLRQSIGLDQGQLLSIPFVIAGIWLIIRAMRRPREELEYPNRFSDEKKDKK